MDGDIVVVREDGHVTIRASALGGCIKALAAVRIGYSSMPSPKQMQTAADEGELHEGDVVRRMTQKGWTVYGQQKEVVLPVTQNISVVGHVDGFATADTLQLIEDWNGNVHELAPGSQVVFDAKSLSKDVWIAYERDGWSHGFFPKYKWQFSDYMLATGLPLVLARKNRNSGEIKYEYIADPFYDLVAIRARALQIESWAIRGEIPETCDPKMFPCPVYYLHEEDENAFEEVPDSDLAELARQYRADYDQAKLLEGRLKTTRSALRSALGLELQDDGQVSEKKSVLALGWKVSFYNQKNPPSTDWAKVIAALGVTREEFDEQYKSQTSTERLKVTAPKNDKKGND